MKSKAEHEFKVGDHVGWNSEAGRVRGTIQKKVTSTMKFKTYTVHASKEEPQYLIRSDKTDHMAMHKGAALKDQLQSALLVKIGHGDKRIKHGLDRFYLIRVSSRNRGCGGSDLKLT